MTHTHSTTGVSFDIDPSLVHWKIQATTDHPEKGPRAMYVPYFDARDVANALDAIFGWAGWQDTYTVVPAGSYATVTCSLRVRDPNDAAGPWIEKGGMAEIEGKGETAVKGAESYAFKRAAAKLGVGRNVYEMEGIWASANKSDAGKFRMPFKTEDGTPFEEALTKRLLAVLAGKRDEGGGYGGD